MAEKRDAPGLDPQGATDTNHLPDSVRQDAEVAWELGYETGYQHALILAAERADELDAIWRPVPRPTYEQKVARRIAEMERQAAKLHAEIGTTEWAGRAA